MISESSGQIRPSIAKREAPSEGANDKPPARELGGLSREVQTLTTVIKQLEEQLDQMMAANDALRKDQEDERSRRLVLEGTLNELHERLRRSEHQVADKENLIAEIKHLTQERTRLAGSARELSAKLKDVEGQREKELRLVERLRAAHADAVEEVQSVEEQFERAMQIVAQVKAQLTIACEERDQLALRSRTTEAQVVQLRQERDALLAEVDQSRAALDEIRRSLVDACLVATNNGDQAAPGARGKDEAGTAR